MRRFESCQGHDRPLFIGEFGTYEQADMNSRCQWTRRVRLEAERLGLSWCYWDFGTDFGMFDPHRDAWREPLKEALLGTPDLQSSRKDPHRR